MSLEFLDSGRTRGSTKDELPSNVPALFEACTVGDKSELQQLLDGSPSLLCARDKNGRTPLHFCAEHENTECADLLLSRRPQLLTVQDNDGYSASHLAVISGNSIFLRYLISRAKKSLQELNYTHFLNCCDLENHSAFHWATVCGETDCLSILYDSGASPTLADMHGAHPIHYAAQMSSLGNRKDASLQTLKKLLRCRGVEINSKDKDGRTPLLWAASTGNSDAILLLTNAGADVSTQDKDGLTALHCAASRGFVDSVETLLTLCGAEMDQMDTNGCSALFYAVTLGNADCTEFLLQHGSESNRQDRKGRSAAHCGAAKGQLETTKILSHHGANLWMRNIKGDLPLHEAVRSGRKELVQWLLDQLPSTVNVTNTVGKTPLHVAALSNNVEMCKVLIDSGADINAVMKSKGHLLTPLDATLQRGYRSCAKFLLLHGALPASRLNGNGNRSLGQKGSSTNGSSDKASLDSLSPESVGTGPGLDRTSVTNPSDSSAAIREVRLPPGFHPIRPNRSRLSTRKVQVLNGLPGSSPTFSCVTTTTEPEVRSQSIITNVYVNTKKKVPSLRKVKRRPQQQQQQQQQWQQQQQTKPLKYQDIPNRSSLDLSDSSVAGEEANGYQSQINGVKGKATSPEHINHPNEGMSDKPTHNPDTIEGRSSPSLFPAPLVNIEAQNVSIEKGRDGQEEEEEEEELSGREHGRETQKDEVENRGLDNKEIQNNGEDRTQSSLEALDAPGVAEENELHTKDLDDTIDNISSISGRTDDQVVDINNILEEEESHLVLDSNDPFHEPNIGVENIPSKEMDLNGSNAATPRPEIDDPAGEAGHEPDIKVLGTLAQKMINEVVDHLTPETQFVSNQSADTEEIDISGRVSHKPDIDHSNKSALNEDIEVSYQGLPETNFEIPILSAERHSESLNDSGHEPHKQDKEDTHQELFEPQFDVPETVFEEDQRLVAGEAYDIEEDVSKRTEEEKGKEESIASEAPSGPEKFDESSQEIELLSTGSQYSLQDSISVLDDDLLPSWTKNRVKREENGLDFGDKYRSATTFELRDHDNEFPKTKRHQIKPRSMSRCSHKFHAKQNITTLGPIDVSHVTAKVNTHSSVPRPPLNGKFKSESNVRRGINEGQPYYHPNLISQTVEKRLRKYQIERKLFEELQELKRCQIRSNRSHEALMVKRLVDKFIKEVKVPGMSGFSGPYTFKVYEKYLYEQLRKLSRSNRGKVALVKSLSDENISASTSNENLVGMLRMSRRGSRSADFMSNVVRPQVGHPLDQIDSNSDSVDTEPESVRSPPPLLYVSEKSTYSASETSFAHKSEATNGSLSQAEERHGKAKVPSRVSKAPKIGTNGNPKFPTRGKVPANRSGINKENKVQLKDKTQTFSEVKDGEGEEDVQHRTKTAPDKLSLPGHPVRKLPSKIPVAEAESRADKPRKAASSMSRYKTTVKFEQASKMQPKWRKECLKSDPRPEPVEASKKRPLFTRRKMDIPPKEMVRIPSQDITRRWGQIKTKEKRRLSSTVKRSSSSPELNEYILLYELNVPLLKEQIEKSLSALDANNDYSAVTSTLTRSYSDSLLYTGYSIN